MYKSALKPLLPLVVKQGIVTCFAYGQTGSGKTYTMNDLQQLIVNELYELARKGFTVTVSYFEIYGGRCLDLLNEKSVLNILEDKNGNIQIPGLTERNAESAKELLGIMEQANANRTTHATVANDTSSRSHAICQVLVRRGSEEVGGKLVLVDLAGSERAQDTQSNNRQRRMEGAEINKR
jgi:kinesin family protein 2/24